jgi:GTP-binding protein HflX
MILADTVGFIRHLPHDLVAAFRSTLQETEEADLLLHVIDAASETRQGNIDQVNDVLSQIGAEDRPQIEVYNKIDLLPQASPRIERSEQGEPLRVWISAQTGEGLDLLLQAIDERLNFDNRVHHLVLPAEAGRLRARLYANGQVLHEDRDNRGDTLMTVLMAQADWKALSKHEHVERYEVPADDARLAAVRHAS